MSLLPEPLLTAFALAAIAHTMPLLLAAVGETLGEQSGVLNVGIEGVLLAGAYSSFVTVVASGNFWLGALVGTLAGMAMAAVMVGLSVWLGVNQIVVGFGLLLLGTGVTSLLYEARFASIKPRIGLAEPWALPWLADLPVIGPALFAQPGLFVLAIAAPILASVWLHRTMPGLRLRAAGQRPESLAAAGGSVRLTRTVAVLCGGAAAGLGGAYLALISAGTFTPVMTHGLGFLAIVVAMLGRGRMLVVALISLGYGLCIAAGTTLQLVSIELSSDLIRLLPFAAVLVALLFVRRGSALPPALAR